MIRRDKTNYTPRYDDPAIAAVAIENSIDGADEETRNKRLQERLVENYKHIQARGKRGEDVKDELIALRLHAATQGDTLEKRTKQARKDYEEGQKRAEKQYKQFEKDRMNKSFNEQLEEVK